MNNYELYVHAAIAMIGFCLMDFPESVTHKSGMHSLSRTIQLAFNAAGGISAILKMLLIPFALYIWYAIGFSPALGIIIIAFLIEGTFRSVVNFACQPKLISLTLATEFLWLGIGIGLAWYSISHLATTIQSAPSLLDRSNGELTTTTFWWGAAIGSAFGVIVWFQKNRNSNMGQISLSGYSILGLVMTVILWAPFVGVIAMGLAWVFG